jgi:hypothetical protein
LAAALEVPSCGRTDAQDPAPAAVALPVIQDVPARRRATTASRKALNRELRQQRALGLVDDGADLVELYALRPRTRGDCEDGERPCPWVSCRHHLAYDVHERTGSIKENFPGREVWELPQTCALDVADEGGITLEAVAATLNLTRERVRQMETRAIAALKAGVEAPPALQETTAMEPVRHLPPSGAEILRPILLALQRIADELAGIRAEMAKRREEPPPAPPPPPVVVAPPPPPPPRRSWGLKPEQQMTLMLRRLAEGPATTAELVAVVHRASQSVADTMTKAIQRGYALRPRIAEYEITDAGRAALAAVPAEKAPAP